MSTMKDIAALAGVSTATVSRALMQPGQVKEQTRDKVLAAIKELGYTPNLMARSLRRQKANTIVVLVPDISNPFFATVIRGIEQVAHENGYSVLLGDTQYNTDREKTFANMLRTKQADGMILLGDRVPEELDPRNEDKSIDAPFVMTCAYEADDRIPNVFIDNYAASEQLTDFIVEKGYKQIGCVIGFDNSITEQRFGGFKASLEKAGLPLKKEWVGVGDFTSESGLEVGRQLLSKNERPEVLFCINDEMAIGVMGSAHELGLRIPEDIAIVGFDDIKVSEFTNPPLSTVSQNPIEMGRAATEMLVEMLDETPLESIKRQLPFELKLRKSV